MFVIIARFQFGQSFWNASASAWGSRRFATEYATEVEARLALAMDGIPRPSMRRGEVVQPVVEVAPA